MPDIMNKNVGYLFRLNDCICSFVDNKQQKAYIFWNFYNTVASNVNLLSLPEITEVSSDAWVESIPKYRIKEIDILLKPLVESLPIKALGLFRCISDGRMKDTKSWPPYIRRICSIIRNTEHIVRFMQLLRRCPQYDD
jgi:hypothetical protein